MDTFVPWAFKAVTDEEILDSIIQSASAEMTPLHINQSLFIFIEPSATQRLTAKAPSWMLMLECLLFTQSNREVIWPLMLANPMWLAAFKPLCS